MKCNLCGNELKDSGNFFKCPNCFLVKKKIIPFPLEEKERYLAHQYDDGYKNYMEKLLSWISFDNKKILDYGCGQQPVLNRLFPKGDFTNYDYYFYPSKNYLKKKYDIILAIEVIEHIADIKATIEEWLGLLKDDGTIYIHTKIYDDKTDFKTWWYQRDITHISFFNLKTFMYIASTYKLHLEKINEFIVLKRK